MALNNNQQAFFELLRAGLWEKEARLLQFKDIDYSVVMQLAEEQSVVGLVTAGIEHVTDVKMPTKDVLPFVGQSLQIEQQNVAMNGFVAQLIDKLRQKDVYALLVKGQGIAQCYERSLWRASGDVDLLLSPDNYEKAKRVLLPLATEVETEYKSLKHLGMTMKGGFVVELHGMMHSRLSSRVDRVVDEAQQDVFCGGNVRSWLNGSTQVFLPSPDNDIILVFTHILKHFYIDGIGLRQICDWCRLLWTYRNSLNRELLESRIRKAGLMSEWKAFAAFAIEYLGMSAEAMPLYSPDKKWLRKAERILEFVLECGNFGHNREIKRSKNFYIRKIQAACFKMGDFARHAKVFPLDSVKFFLHYLGDGIQQARAKKPYYFQNHKTISKNELFPNNNLMQD